MKYEMLLPGSLLAGCRASTPPPLPPTADNLEAAAPPPDPDSVAILSYDKANEYFYWDNRKELFGNATHLSLTPQDLLLVDSLLRQSIAASNEYQQQRGYTGPPLSLNGYKRQLLAVVTEAGEKQVWVNCLCEVRDGGWKKKTIRGSGGGDCYFNVRLNLSKKSWSEADVNALY